MADLPIPHQLDTLPYSDRRAAVEMVWAWLDKVRYWARQETWIADTHARAYALADLLNQLVMSDGRESLSEAQAYWRNLILHLESLQRDLNGVLPSDVDIDRQSWDDVLAHVSRSRKMMRGVASGGKGRSERYESFREQATAEACRIRQKRPALSAHAVAKQIHRDMKPDGTGYKPSERSIRRYITQYFEQPT
jgi:hypothetical protein